MSQNACLYLHIAPSCVERCPKTYITNCLITFSQKDRNTCTWYRYLNHRHSPFRHHSRDKGGGDASPSRWPLSEVELRFKKVLEFKVLDQPVTSEVRSMTCKWPKCDVADNFVSEQAHRAAILRPEHSLWSKEYNACNVLRSPAEHFGGKIKHEKLSFVLEYLYHDPSDPIWTHMNEKRMPN